MFALAVVSLCNGRTYFPIDNIWFSLSMAGGTIEPIRFALHALRGAPRSLSLPLRCGLGGNARAQDAEVISDFET